MSLKTNNLPVLNCESVIPRIAIAFLLCLGLVNTPTRVHAAPTRPIDKQLLDACMGSSTKHDLAVIQGLIKKGANVNARSENGETALMSAASSGNISNMECLIKLGADLEARDCSGQTALFRATGKPAAFRWLLGHHANFKVQDKDGYQPIHWAVIEKESKCIKWLVEHGADVNARTRDGSTPIAFTTSPSGIKVAEYLIAHGADINLVNDEGPIWAHQLYDDKMLAFFLSHGAQVDARNKEGYTALLRAASVRKANTLRLLLSYGADADAKTLKGETADILAARRGEGDHDRDAVMFVLSFACGQNIKLIPKKSDILLSPVSDEVAVIRALVSQGDPKDMAYALIDQDTFSGPEAAKEAFGDGNYTGFLEVFDKRITQELLEAFVKSKEPSKVIPAFSGPAGIRFARGFDIDLCFQHDDKWNEFYVKYPEVNGEIQISQPIFDKNHSRAIIYYMRSYEVSACYSYLTLLEKSNGDWRTVQSIMLWIS